MDEYKLQDIWKKKLREFNDVMRLDSIIIRAMREAIKEAQTEQLILSGVSQQRELLDWLSNEPDHNIRKSDIDEILQDFKYYQSNCG